ncbi:S8 family peptidase [Micromonospora sp. NPDC049559]|uniref:S8 family peptidase n=1 Tax=Micromonospora sp. NPDC049559 TaxID=3155923 RepID=UPI00343D6439
MGNTRERQRWLLSRSLAGAAALALVAVADAAQAAPPAEGPIHVPARAAVVEGRYIVSLKGAAGPSVQSAAGAVAGRYGGRVERTYRTALNGFVLTATEAQARRLAADPQVERVEADSMVRGADTRPYPIWNLDRVDQRSSVLDDAYGYPAEAGVGVTAYILDTGIRTTHTQFGGRATVGFDAIADGWNGQDCNEQGHGTHVAGTVGGATYGMANRVNLVSVRVLGCNNLGTVSQIIAGVDWVTQNAQRPAVVNMSLGGAESASEETAVAASIASGITYVVAAGNWEQDACGYSPAGLPAAITVGASNTIGERATGWGGDQPGSNYGSCLDLFAPGESIKSAHNATDRATRVLRGTSMAAPHVAGAAALVLSKYPDATPAQVANLLTSRATPDAVRADTLRGSPNRFLYSAEVIDPPAAPAP